MGMVNLLCEFGVWGSVLVYLMGIFFMILWVWCVKECLSLCHLVCVCERVFDEFG